MGEGQCRSAAMAATTLTHRARAQAEKLRGAKIIKNERETPVPKLAGEESDDDDDAARQEGAFGCIDDAIPEPDTAFNAIEPETPSHDDPQHQDHHQVRAPRSEAYVQLTRWVANGFSSTRIWIVQLQATVTARRSRTNCIV